MQRRANKYKEAIVKKRSFALILVFLLPLACGRPGSEEAGEKAAERAIERATGEKVDIEAKVDLSKIPPELVYPGAKGEGMVTMTTKEGKGTSVTFATSADPRSVADYYDNTLPDRGWERTVRTESADEEGLTVFSAFEKKGQGAIITIAPGEEGKTSINIVLSQEE
jgi:hypothetical protein